MFLVAALVWNHALFADDADAKARRRELVDELARRGMPRDAGEDLVDELTLRKEFVFRHDPRFIEHVEVFDGELGEVRVRCAFTL